MVEDEQLYDEFKKENLAGAKRKTSLFGSIRS
jgi:hypothetical protein